MLHACEILFSGCVRGRILALPNKAILRRGRGRAPWTVGKYCARRRLSSSCARESGMISLWSTTPRGPAPASLLKLRRRCERKAPVHAGFDPGRLGFGWLIAFPRDPPGNGSGPLAGTKAAPVTLASRSESSDRCGSLELTLILPLTFLRFLFSH